MNVTMKQIRDNRGFSMMEMMIVLVVIGLLASLAAPSLIQQMPRLETKTQIKQVLSKLREARSLAISRNAPAGVCFDASASTWKVFLDNNPANNLLNSGDSVTTSGKLGTRLTVAYNSFSNQGVIFNSDGSCYMSGAVWLTAVDNSVTYTIDVLASTGRVRLREGAFTSGS